MTANNNILETKTEQLDKEILGYVFAVISAACFFGPFLAYLLGWANMPLFVALITTVFTVPFGIILAMLAWHVLSSWTRCVYDKDKDLLTIKHHSDLGPLGNMMPSNFLEGVTGLSDQKMGKDEEETYPLSSFQAVILERCVTRTRSRKHGSSTHISFVIKLKNKKDEALEVDRVKYMEEGKGKAKLLSSFLELELVELNMP